MMNISLIFTRKDVTAMVIKAIGGILVFISCAALGLYYSLKESFRIGDLAELKKAMLLLKGEIGFAHCSLTEAADNVAARLKPRLARFFERLSVNLSVESGFDVAGAWGEAVSAKLAILNLNDEDLRNMERLGETLGYLGKQTQIEGLEMAVLYIDGQVERLRESEGRTRRLYRSAGVILGLLIVIVLI
jgi:stage III sporulation protein AB